MSSLAPENSRDNDTAACEHDYSKGRVCLKCGHAETWGEDYPPCGCRRYGGVKHTQRNDGRHAVRQLEDDGCGMDTSLLELFRESANPRTLIEANEWSDHLATELERVEDELIPAAREALTILSSFARSFEREGISSPAMRERLRAAAFALRAAL